MPLIVEELEDKHPVEQVQYAFNLARNSAFPSSGESISAVQFYCYDESDLSTNIPAMVLSTSYDDPGKKVMCDIDAGTDDHSYLLAGVITCLSGRKYLVRGRFKVESFGVSAT